jgi:hypothetical protein
VRVSEEQFEVWQPGHRRVWTCLQGKNYVTPGDEEKKTKIKKEKKELCSKKGRRTKNKE